MCRERGLIYTCNWQHSDWRGPYDHHVQNADRKWVSLSLSLSLSVNNSWPWKCPQLKEKSTIALSVAFPFHPKTLEYPRAFLYFPEMPSWGPITPLQNTQLCGRPTHPLLLNYVCMPFGQSHIRSFPRFVKLNSSTWSHKCLFHTCQLLLVESDILFLLIYIGARCKCKILHHI